MDAAVGVAGPRRAGRPHLCWCGRPVTVRAFLMG